MSLRGVMRTVTGTFAVIVAAAAAGAIAAVGYLIPVQRPDAAQAVAQPMQGRVSSVCTTGTLTGRHTDSSESTVYGSATRADDGASGSLTGRLLGDGDTGNPKLSIDKQGQSKTIKSPPRSVVLVADGVLAGASAGMVYGSANSGEDRGL
ncbi:MAG: hypothetical protein J2P23_10100, partial [Microlunatus sp.]|nr:hypothetical protein [Microlunatus sp.]